MAHDDRRAIIRAYDRLAGEYLDRFGAPPLASVTRSSSSSRWP